MRTTAERYGETCHQKACQVRLRLRLTGRLVITFLRYSERLEARGQPIIFADSGAASTDPESISSLARSSWDRTGLVHLVKFCSAGRYPMRR